MSQEDSEEKVCACVQAFRDMMRAAPPKKDWLRKTTCPRCKKEFWTNRDTDYCFDCESHASK